MNLHLSNLFSFGTYPQRDPLFNPSRFLNHHNLLYVFDNLFELLLLLLLFCLRVPQTRNALENQILVLQHLQEQRDIGDGVGDGSRRGQIARQEATLQRLDLELEVGDLAEELVALASPALLLAEPAPFVAEPALLLAEPALLLAVGEGAMADEGVEFEFIGE